MPEKNHNEDMRCTYITTGRQNQQIFLTLEAADISVLDRLDELALNRVA
jgi:hypothetical protein